CSSHDVCWHKQYDDAYGGSQPVRRKGASKDQRGTERSTYGSQCSCTKDIRGKRLYYESQPFANGISGENKRSCKGSTSRG
ncbi:hypothetical protein PTT_02566, partial [Pyrenophora teres f. teres 0-1]